jgi:hypothetical protein
MSESTTSSRSARNLILQQGISAPPPAGCGRLSSALVFQPRVVGVVALAGIILQDGIILQEPAIFAALAIALWWSAFLPRLNPFDAVYNWTFGARPGAVRLDPAPAPRCFAQGMAASFTTAIALCLAGGYTTAAWILEGFMLVAVTAIALGRLCLGSFVFHLISGRGSFAVRTLPWGRGD